MYQELAEKLDTAGLGAPPSPELRTILAELFTPDEARIALALAFRPTPLGRLATALGRSEPELQGILEGMADKGLVFARRSGKGAYYALLPVLPGMFELQFMRGETGPRQTRLAVLYEQYYRKDLQGRIAGRRSGFARVIPVERAIPNPMEILPYERVSHFIREGQQYALTQCHCRHQQELIGEGCGAPKDVCMMFGPFAAFAVERGFARAASRDEMLRALDRAEEHGLVHVSDNVVERINFLCNCCACCCGFLRAADQAGRANVVATSRYRAQVDAGACTSCGVCVERCPVGALAVGEEATVDEPRCLGCGACLSACPTEALTLAPRSQHLPPHATRLELDAAVQRERAADA